MSGLPFQLRAEDFLTFFTGGGVSGWLFSVLDVWLGYGMGWDTRDLAGYTDGWMVDGRVDEWNGTQDTGTQRSTGTNLMITN